jgi:hypothetical protein
MKPELGGNGAGAPLIDQAQAQYLIGLFRGHCHKSHPLSELRDWGDGDDSAKTRFVPKRCIRDGKNGIAGAF